MIIQILVYKVVLAKLKYLYLVYHVGRQNLRESINNLFTKVKRLLDIIINLFFEEGTIARRQFMRGTDPIKSTWVYPKLIL
jgi:hypothetical protein